MASRLEKTCPCWTVVTCPSFASTGRARHAGVRHGPPLRYRNLPRKFNKAIHAIDSTTIALVANCMDLAKHRRRKAAAKLHMRLDLQHFLPAFAVIEEASHHDNARARAELQAVTPRADALPAQASRLARTGVQPVGRAPAIIPPGRPTATSPPPPPCPRAPRRRRSWPRRTACRFDRISSM